VGSQTNLPQGQVAARTKDRRSQHSRGRCQTSMQGLLPSSVACCQVRLALQKLEVSILSWNLLVFKNWPFENTDQTSTFEAKEKFSTSGFSASPACLP
jgi:hypothetical protein